MDYTTAINKALESGQYELADRLTALAEQQSYAPQPTHYYQPPPTQIYIPQPPPQGYIQQHQPVYEEVDYSPEPVTYYYEPSKLEKIKYFLLNRPFWVMVALLSYGVVAQLSVPGTDKYNWTWGWDVTLGHIVSFGQEQYGVFKFRGNSDDANNIVPDTNQMEIQE